MPKNDFFGTKAAANRIKAKGLQKLRWYCQVCQKQCRDENGYRNHIQSEPHQRKISLFSEDANRHVEDFSRQFQEGFLNIVKRRYATKKVYANQVYQEYISDRHHIHMNSTRWATVSEFIIHLGRAGICKIEEGERLGSWYIQWIDNSPKELARLEALSHIDRSRKDNAERDRLFLERQIEMGKSLLAEVDDTDESKVERELKRNDKTQKISISFGSSKASSSSNNPSTSAKRVFESDDYSSKESEERETKIQKVSEITVHENQTNEEEDDEEPWILEGIMVRVRNKELAGGVFYNKLGKLLRVIDEYVAEISVCKNERSRADIIRIDQAQLETVVPLPGDIVILLKYPNRGQKATIIALDPKTRIAKVRIQNTDKIISCNYDSFSEIAI